MIFERIKQLAKNKGISIYQLERDNNLSNGSISKWNRVTPSAESLNSVAKSLDTTMDEILNSSEKIQEVK